MGLVLVDDGEFRVEVVGVFLVLCFLSVGYRGSYVGLLGVRGIIFLMSKDWAFLRDFNIMLVL